MEPFIINLSNSEDDFYTPTGWEREHGESDEDYNERTEDMESWLENIND